jgi:hypothetical protein
VHSVKPYSVILLLYYSLTSRLSRRGLRTLSPGTISRGTRKTPICTATLPECTKLLPIAPLKLISAEALESPAETFLGGPSTSKESSNLLHCNSVHLSARDKGIRGLYDSFLIIDIDTTYPVVYLLSFSILSIFFSFLNGLLCWGNCWVLLSYGMYLSFSLDNASSGYQK